jgi:hypothetical protein
MYLLDYLYVNRTFRVAILFLACTCVWFCFVSCFVLILIVRVKKKKSVSSVVNFYVFFFLLSIHGTTCIYNGKVKQNNIKTTISTLPVRLKVVSIHHTCTCVVLECIFEFLNIHMHKNNRDYSCNIFSRPFAE